MAMGNKGDVILMYQNFLENRKVDYDRKLELTEEFHFSDNEEPFKTMIGHILKTGEKQVDRCLKLLNDYVSGNMDNETFEKMDKQFEVKQIYEDKR